MATEKIKGFLLGTDVLIWSPRDVEKLKVSWRIVGGLIGAHPHYPRQNIQLSLPFVLLPEEVSLLLGLGVLEVCESTHMLNDERENARDTVEEEEGCATVKEEEDARGTAKEEEGHATVEEEERATVEEEERATVKEEEERATVEEENGNATVEEEERATVKEEEGCATVEEEEHATVEEENGNATVEEEGRATVKEEGCATVEEEEERATVEEENGNATVEEEERATVKEEEGCATVEEEERATVEEENGNATVEEEERATVKEEGCATVEEEERATVEEEEGHATVEGEEACATVEEKEEEVRSGKLLQALGHVIRAGWKDPHTSTTLGQLKCMVFRDLWDRGYYLTSGLKYGADFLVYHAHPSHTHASCIAIVIAWQEPLNKRVGSLCRVGANVKKTVLLCSVKKNSVLYMTLEWTQL